MFASSNNLSMIIANGGGTFTLNGSLADISQGYMVSLDGFQITTPVTGLSESGFTDMANEIVAKVGDLVDLSTHFVGAWVDDNLLYVDLSVRIDDLDTALEKAATANQLAIYDIANGTDIKL